MRDGFPGSSDGPIAIERDAHGVPHLRVTTEPDLYRALGYCHGTDRALAMLLARTLGYGRGCELLRPSEDLLATDRFFRRLDLAGGVREELARVTPDDRARAEAYCEGVNQALAHGIPWELRVLGYAAEPWTLCDSLMLSRLAGFVALAQSQGDIERLLVETVQAGVPREHLEELFAVRLSEDELALLRRLRLGERLVPEAVRSSPVVPHALASNNWVIAPRRTASGQAMLANDPHLEVGRLPAVWYEVVAELGERFCIAATMPGLPALLLGRTNDLAWGATYTFMDAIDSWVEDCRDGCYRRVVDGREVWEPFRVREEVVKRKGLSDVVLRFHENDHGVLDGDPRQPGLYLATRWSSAAGTGARSLGASFAMLWARDVEQGRDVVGRIETAWNWVLADRRGNIGYQMSGLMPLRRDGWSGLVPQPGWDPENDWRGFVPVEDLPRALNPEQGFLVTANDDLNHLGRRAPINAPMGAYRAERIAALLAERSRWTVADLERMQMDDYSLHAERFMEVLRPLLPVGGAAQVLREWDCRYDLASRGAPLFEDVYRALLLAVFGPRLGERVMHFLCDETAVVADFYACFDRVLLDEHSAWFGEVGRAATFEAVALAVLAAADRRGRLERWGERQELTMKHLLLGGKLPAWLGFDQGPLALPGNRATIHQTQIYRSGGRDTSFAPSYRLVTDLAEPSAHTCLAGGPSDRRFSRWYASGVDDWLAGRFKTLAPGAAARRREE